jgi:hypothetical protein
MENISFILTPEQAQDICKHYNMNASEMEDYEICELLDRLIDDTLFGYVTN